MRRTPSLTSSAALRTGTTSRATAARRRPVQRQARVHGETRRATAAGATASPRLAAAPPVRLRTSTPRTNRASRSSTTRLRLRAGAEACRGGAVVPVEEVDLPTGAALLVADVEDSMPVGVEMLSAVEGEAGGIGKR